MGLDGRWLPGGGPHSHQSPGAWSDPGGPHGASEGHLGSYFLRRKPRLRETEKLARGAQHASGSGRRGHVPPCPSHAWSPSPSRGAGSDGTFFPCPASPGSWELSPELCGQPEPGLWNFPSPGARSGESHGGLVPAEWAWGEAVAEGALPGEPGPPHPRAQLGILGSGTEGVVL